MNTLLTGAFAFGLGVSMAVQVVLFVALWRATGGHFQHRPMLPGTRWMIHGGPTVEITQAANGLGRVLARYPSGEIKIIRESDLRAGSKQFIPSAGSIHNA